MTEMIPVDHVGCPTPAKYFADVLARSLCRETRARAWCEETGGYAPIKQRRCPISLPGKFVSFGSKELDFNSICSYSSRVIIV